MTELTVWRRGDITDQPDFIYEDLTEPNAEFLELFMMNLDNIEQFHRAADKMSWSFRAGHKALLTCAQKLYDESYHSALDHGITTLEATAAAVGANSTSVDQLLVNRRILKIAHMDEADLQRYSDDAIDELTYTSPRTVEVLHASASRFHGPLSTYALIGAALTWKLERSISES